ncbi:MAG: response regulator [Planctomycetota bacterium]|jgi:two-component system chemotaxis response regulator CheY
MKVLIVDDSAVMRKVLIGALSRGGIQDVVQAGDGQQALEAVKEQKFDMILMEWNMPRMPGIDAVRKLRADGCTTPIIMVTAEAEKRRVIEALKSGVNNYVIKPFKADTIVSKIQETLEKASE